MRRKIPARMEYICDRCAAKVEIEEEVDARLPKGWKTVLLPVAMPEISGDLVQLCDRCAPQYHALVMKWMENL